MDLNEFKGTIAVLIMVVLIIGAGALALDEFDNQIGEDYCTGTLARWDDAASQCYNCPDAVHTNFDAGDNTCHNGTATQNISATATNPTIQSNVTGEGLTGVANASGYLSTIGTLIGVAALIAVVVGAFMFARR